MGSWIDISLPVKPGMACYLGSSGVTFVAVKSMADGDMTNDAAIEADLHAGTHIDAPRHFIDGGKTIEELDINSLLGKAYVAAVPNSAMVTALDLENADIPSGTNRLLVRTDNSVRRKNMGNAFETDYVALDITAARWLVDRKVQLVGLDSLSIEKFGGDGSVHRTILGAGIIVLEGVDLGSVSPGVYDLCCLPPAYTGVEAAPARALLRPAIGER